MLKNVLQLALDTREYLTPVLNESAFLEEGVLTPDEFVSAGTALATNCPTWQWMSSDEGKEKSWLPSDKQYLMTRGVACFRRVSDLDSSTEVDREIDDWCAPTFDKNMRSDNDDFELVESENMDSSLALDASAVPPGSMSTIGNDLTMSTPTLQPRRYDCYLTYDKYYRTPRIWLAGYSETGSPLTAAQMFQDVMIDYARKTVTIEAHPHVRNLMCASIHPCRHASAMKTIIDSIGHSNNMLRADQSLFIFLKFCQSVIPTIEYDFTTEVQMKA
eukprot:GSChrysophyteH1.ASY1.ANO1.3352.1 assembled CDS